MKFEKGSLYKALWVILIITIILPFIFLMLGDTKFINVYSVISGPLATLIVLTIQMVRKDLLDKKENEKKRIKETSKELIKILENINDFDRKRLISSVHELADNNNGIQMGTAKFSSPKNEYIVEEVQKLKQYSEGILKSQTLKLSYKYTPLKNKYGETKFANEIEKIQALNENINEDIMILNKIIYMSDDKHSAIKFKGVINSLNDMSTSLNKMTDEVRNKLEKIINEYY